MAPLTFDPNQSRPLRIAVVGGGVIGVCSALALQQEYPRAEVSILSDKWTPQTTGDVSAGFIFPYAVGEKTRPCLLRRTLSETIKFYHRLIQNPLSGKFGVSLITMYDVSEDETCEVPDLPELPDVRAMPRKEVEAMFPGFKSGFCCATYIAEPALMLPFLMEKFEAAGGKLVTQKVTSLSSLAPTYDLIINCTGLGARFLEDVQDMSVEPVRGQVIRVRAPWVRHAIMAGPYYILPNRDCVILGGTKEKGNFNLKPDPDTAARILRECCKVIPSLARAEKIADGVGLRPYRPAIRIERDLHYPKVIHNYGHGGSGVTLCWGSAVEVVKLAREALTQNGLKSKL